VKKVRVLSIDGGGVRVILAVKMLARLEHHLGGPLHEAFDLVIGTSAGAITGCCLAQRMSAAEIDTRWDELCRSTFPPPRRLGDFARRLANKAGILTKYDGTAVDGLLVDLFGDRSMGELHIPHTLTVSFDPSTMHVQVCRSSDPDQSDTPVREACRASGASPTYIPAAGPRRLLDGGVIANNPATFGVLHGLQVARERFGEQAADNLFVVSIGSGMPMRDRTTARSFLSQTRRMIDIAMYTDLQVGNHLLPDKNYFRLQPTVPPELAVTDNTRRLPKLRLFADSFVSSIDPSLQHIAAELAA